MYNKTYTVSIPLKIKKSKCIEIVNSMLIKLRYYWEMVEIHKRRGSKPNEAKYFEFLKMYRHTSNELRRFGVEIKKK